jgi:hypothetical protein
VLQRVELKKKKLRGDAHKEVKLQSFKKLSQCLAILKRLTCGKSNKLHNNLKIIYVILGYLGTQTNPRPCDLV